MAFVPNGIIYLLQVPLEADNKNQLSFANETDQYNYFITKKQNQFTDLTYIRKDNILRIPTHIDSLWNVNYIMYKNSNFTNKWFYAFVINRRYINDSTTEFTIATDVFQTWQFNYEIKESFVEREHCNVSDDLPRK